MSLPYLVQTIDPERLAICHEVAAFADIDDAIRHAKRLWRREQVRVLYRYESSYGNSQSVRWANGESLEEE